MDMKYIPTIPCGCSSNNLEKITADIIVKDLAEKYKTNKEMCKNMIDFYLKVSNVEEIVESVRKFGKEYNL
jgi:hypothetical protein